LAWQAVFSRIMGNLEAAEQVLQQSLLWLDHPTLAAQNTDAERAFTLLQLGHLSLGRDNEKAGAYYDQALELSQALGNRWAVATVMAGLGKVAHEIGDYSTVQACFAESMAIQRAVGDRLGLGNSLETLSINARYRGQLEESKQLAQELLDLCREMGNRNSLARGLGNLGMALAVLGEFDQAHDLVAESVTIFADLGVLGQLVGARIRLGSILMNLGRYAEAQAELETALALAGEISQSVGFALWMLGLLAMAQAKEVQARQWLKESIAVYQEIGKRSYVGRVLAGLGHVDRALGEISLARQNLLEALRIGVDIPDINSVIAALLPIALLLADAGETVKAVELYYALAGRLPLVAQSHWYEDLYGQYFTAAATALPPDRFEAAQARGRALDLWETAESLLTELTERGWGSALETEIDT